MQVKWESSPWEKTELKFVCEKQNAAQGNGCTRVDEDNQGGTSCACLTETFSIYLRKIVEKSLHSIHFQKNVLVSFLVA